MVGDTTRKYAQRFLSIFFSRRQLPFLFSAPRVSVQAPACEMSRASRYAAGVSGGRRGVGERGGTERRGCHLGRQGRRQRGRSSLEAGSEAHESDGRRDERTSSARGFVEKRPGRDDRAPERGRGRRRRERRNGKEAPRNETEKQGGRAGAPAKGVWGRVGRRVRVELAFSRARSSQKQGKEKGGGERGGIWPGGARVESAFDFAWPTQKASWALLFFGDCSSRVAGHSNHLGRLQNAWTEVSEGMATRPWDALLQRSAVPPWAALRCVLSGDPEPPRRATDEAECAGVMACAVCDQTDETSEGARPPARRDEGGEGAQADSSPQAAASRMRLEPETRIDPGTLAPCACCASHCAPPPSDAAPCRAAARSGDRPGEPVRVAGREHARGPTTTWPPLGCRGSCPYDAELCSWW